MPRSDTPRPGTAPRRAASGERRQRYQAERPERARERALEATQDDAGCRVEHWLKGHTVVAKRDVVPEQALVARALAPGAE